MKTMAIVPGPASGDASASSPSARAGCAGTHQALIVDIDEIAVPLPRRVRGQVRRHPPGRCPFVTPLDAARRHRRGPIALGARIEVDLDQPGLRWRGGGRAIAQRLAPDGRRHALDTPARQPLPRSKSLLERTRRHDTAVPPRVPQTLDDTPFHVRSVLSAGMLGEAVTAVHETLCTASPKAAPGACAWMGQGRWRSGSGRSGPGDNGTYGAAGMASG